MSLNRGRSVKTATILVLAGTFLFALLSASGAWDPAPQGAVAWQRMPGIVAVSAQSLTARWVGESGELPPTSIRLEAAYEEGEEDIGYGLLLEQETNSLIITLSPLGYVSVWRANAADGFEFVYFDVSWRTWPHIKTGRESNEILLNIAGDRMTLFINRERFWQSRAPRALGRIGIIVASYGQESKVDFQAVELFSE